jgi:hypothetical protein
MRSQNKDALDLLCRRSRASQSLLLPCQVICPTAETRWDRYADLSARRHSPFSRSVSGRFPSSSRQGFLTSGSSALLHGLPNLQTRSVTLLVEATQSPVHSGGNRAGFTPASLVTLYGHLQRSTKILSDTGLNSDLTIKVTKNKMRHLGCAI